MSNEQVIRIIKGEEAARQTVLCRRSLDEYEATPAMQAEIQQLFGQPLTPDEVVTQILRDVRAEGDCAVRRYSLLLDKGVIQPVRVPEERIQLAWQRTPLLLQQALQCAAARIADFYRHQAQSSWLSWDDKGGAQGQIVRPLERVGIYAPNGRAPYPSSLLMAAIPAKVAGVPQVVVVTPPRNGELNDTILAAAYVAGVSEVYAIGGAQAIGALAFGTATVPKVDKIMGPGNIFVVLAKRRVYGTVGIDQLPGPTETLLVADQDANPVFVAADMLAQAEHDPLASAILITTSDELALRVRDELTRQLGSLSRRDVIEASLAANGAIVIVPDLQTALNLANEYAPEHLCLLVNNPWEYLGQVRNAGGVFVGEWASEALGDYVIGPSHIMPTGQTARFSSPVNVWDFCKITSVFNLNKASVPLLSETAITLAEQEGLTAHAQAVRLRLAECKPEGNR
ncbi:MAG: histidinol dehydrogenase [Anaerolineae bacterium]